MPGFCYLVIHCLMISYAAFNNPFHRKPLYDHIAKRDIFAVSEKQLNRR